MGYCLSKYDDVRLERLEKPDVSLGAEVGGKSVTINYGAQDSGYDDVQYLEISLDHIVYLRTLLDVVEDKLRGGLLAPTPAQFALWKEQERLDELLDAYADKSTEELREVLRLREEADKDAP